MHIQENVSLSGHTSLQIGGPAQFFTVIASIEELQQALTFAKQKNLPFLIIGSGTNLLVADEGFQGLIIQNNLLGLTVTDKTITVSAGESLDKLVECTIEHGLDGMSTMKGIPGTVGGAIYGSVGAYGDNIRDYIEEIHCFDGQKMITIKKDRYITGYRDSIFKTQKQLIIVEATFSGFPEANPHLLRTESLQILEKRAQKYPPDTKCPGSFFKNVPIDTLSSESLTKIPPEKIMFQKVPAGFLLEAVGAKGKQRGQIKIADNHGNTFINLGSGTADDFYKLAKEQFDNVKLQFGITLEPEVQFVNLPPFD